MRVEGGEIGAAALDQNTLEAQRSHFRPRAAACVDSFRSGHDAGAEHQILAGGGDGGQAEIASLLTAEIVFDGGAQLEVVHSHPGGGVDEVDLPFVELEQGPHHGLAVQHQMVDAVELHEGREIVAGVRIENHFALGRPGGHVAASGRWNERGQDSGPEDQRHVGMQRMAGGIEQVVQQKHVHAAPAEEGLDHRPRNVGPADLVMLQIDEDGLPLGGELAPRGEPLHQIVDALANGHAITKTAMDAVKCPFVY